jgi:hypothetical protein
MERIWKCNGCSATDLESDIELDVHGEPYRCNNCFDEDMVMLPQSSLKVTIKAKAKGATTEFTEGMGIGIIGSKELTYKGLDKTALEGTSFQMELHEQYANMLVELFDIVIEVG